MTMRIDRYLGLGDIILPGFLIALSARYDEASRLIDANMTNTGIEPPKKWYHGFYFPMMVAYTIGLFFAFLAAILMKQGQPALLYICPSCLTTMFILGRKDIKDLWLGAKVFRLADRLITKTERDWGELRMKQFAEQRRLKNQDLEASPLNEHRSGQGSTRNSNESILDERSFSSEDTEPRPKDVCFGHEDHPGSRAFRSIVEEVAADFENEEYRPEIYKMIKKKLKGRRFFLEDHHDWVEATKLETRKEIGRAYDSARGESSAVLE